MSEEFKSNIEENSSTSSSISTLIFYIIILIISLLLLIAILIFIIKKINQPKREIQKNNSITPNIHFQTEEPPSLNSRNDKTTSNRQNLEIGSNTDKTTENRYIIDSMSVAPPKLNNNQNCEDIEISKTFNSESYTENEESNEDKDKKNDVVVISDMTTKTTNL